MQRRRTILALGVPATAAVLVAALSVRPAPAASSGTVSLMETLSEWKYPGSKMLGGASMSDGGNPQLPSIKCQAILTTPDPIEEVIAFYSEKLGDADAKSVSTRDDSQGRPVTLRVIVVNKHSSSTTLVISRAAGETETHIAWLHYVRFEDKSSAR